LRRGGLAGGVAMAGAGGIDTRSCALMIAGSGSRPSASGRTLALTQPIAT
jgi:hypothetical protein